ncbi:fungal-specific transcription factor domain-containing protein [Xylariaceae sp. FL0662B]|nr:fungal-specific transcription factor domain-containing protein [Xylariaceae sp. FL0662B]
MSPFSRSSQTPGSRAASLKPETVKGPEPEVTDDEASVLLTLGTESPASVPHGNPAESSSETPSLPLQKRRRVTRACDECRRKKIKCDGKQPCTHCQVYSYECTYDKPSNRRRNPAPQYIEALENKLSRAEALLRKFMPDVDLNDPNLDPLVQQEFRMREQARLKTVAAKGKQSSSSSSVDAQLQSMIENAGQLDLDEKGDYYFHGNSSGSVFFKRMKEHFRSLLGRDYQIPFLPRPPRPTGMLNLDSSRPPSSSRTQSSSILEAYNLPPKDRALALCSESLNNATCLLRIVHLPSFYQMLDNLYEKPANGFGKEDKRKLALAFSVMALGSMYDVPEDKGMGTPPYKISMEEALKYYNTAKVLLQDVTECRDLMSLQALLFMVLFIQSISNLSTCYGFVGIALRSALRMGLHRRLPHIKLSAIETETRRRVFYICRQMDTYVSALLGFPLLLNDDDIDQPLPTEVDDQYITKDEILVPPPGTPSFFEAFNAHVKLMDILRMVVKHIYPLKGIEQSEVEGVGEPYASYTISYGKVKEMEKELQQWNEELPVAWRPNPEGPVEVVRVRNLLRFTYAHVQMMLYRPFLHYVSPCISAGKEVNERAYACGVAGISVARNIVHIGTEMRKQVPLVGPYWFTLFSEYSAVISLVFFVLENQDKPGTMEILSDAVAGKDMISALSGKSMVADRISSALDVLFDQLPENLKDIKARAMPSKKRPASELEAGGVSMPPPLTYATDSSHHQAERSAQPNEMSSKKAGKAPISTVLQDLSVDTSPLPEPDFGGSFPSFHFSPLDLSMPSPDSMAATGLHEPNQMDLQHQVTCAGNPIHQLDALMFPSDDPLAYPNQPRADFGVPQPGMNSASPGDIPHHDPSQFYIPNLYDNIEGQLMGPLPPYLMQSHAQPGFGFPAQIYSEPMLQQMNQMGHRQPQPHPAQPRLMRRRVQQQRDADALLANSQWSALLPHGSD